MPQRSFDWRHHAQAWRRQLAQPALLRLFGIGFVLTSVFVALFNYLGFRLAAAPYHFSPTQISLVFLSYTLGIFSSGSSGALSQRLGRRGALATGLGLMGLGVLVTLGSSLAAIATGVGLVTISGGQRPAVRVQANPVALASYGLSMETLRSALAVPLEGMNDVMGVLALYSADRDAFTKDHLRVLLAMCLPLTVLVQLPLGQHCLEHISL